MRRFSLACRHTLVLGLTCLVLLGSTAVVRGAGPDPYQGAGPLDVYTVLVDSLEFQNLVVFGFDVGEAEIASTADPNVREVSLVLSSSERERLMRETGIVPRLWRDESGLSFTQQADATLADQQTFNVWRPYDGANGIKAELDQLAADHPDIVERVVVGQTVHGRDIVGLRVTKGGATVPQGTRPAVLYNALQHAREWIAPEVNRRLLRHFIENYGKDDTVTSLVDSIELWFIPVANPDGYERTFTEGNRLWRKNTRDNNGDGMIGTGDGVDMNRNFAARWKYDTQGSGSNPGSETYRGPSPASEPEVMALQNLLQRVKFNFLINYHSAAQLLLYPDGWQDATRVADDPIFTALAGDYFKPAIEGFLPELSSGLYITNGETCDFAHGNADALCYTPELSTPPPGSTRDCNSTFCFPDNEELIQAEFMRNLPFAMDIAKSTADPTNPVSHLGNTARSMIAEAFPLSYGDPQPVQANVLRKLGDVTMAFRIGSGATTKVPATEWDGGERYGDTGDVFYRRVRGTVTGAKPGDNVTVWFEAGGQQTAEFSYRQVSDSGAPVLLLAAEDYTGTSPVYAKTDGPSYLDIFKESLDENDYRYDVYDVDANDRQAPSQLGVLSHYKAVVWYTGDDLVTRIAEHGEGNGASREMLDMMLAIRGFLNEGGKVFYSGKHAGGQYTRGHIFDPVADAPCLPAANGVEGCESIKADFVRYYLGGWQYRNVDKVNGATVVGTGVPFEDLRIEIDGPGAMAMDHGGAFVVTSQNLPVEEYPIFASRGVASWESVGTRPHTGEHYVYSGAVMNKWQRLGRTIDLTQATSATLRFWTERQTRSPFDAVIVEARMPEGEGPPPPDPNLKQVFLPALHNGSGPEGVPGPIPAKAGWTTLPDANGHTSSTAALSCASDAWFSRFPQLTQYMTRTPSPDPMGQATCTPKGTTGNWHAATGASGGWEEWSIDLSGYAGHRVEIYITHFSSAQAFPGAFVDDVEITIDGQVTDTTSFEDDFGGWAVSGLPVNNAPHDADFQRITTAGLPPVNGVPIVATEDAITFGFGFEAIASRDDRVAVMRKALEYLGVAP
jgi:hypothetical protein